DPAEQLVAHDPAAGAIERLRPFLAPEHQGIGRGLLVGRQSLYALDPQPDWQQVLPLGAVDEPRAVLREPSEPAEPIELALEAAPQRQQVAHVVERVAQGPLRQRASAPVRARMVLADIDVEHGREDLAKADLRRTAG